MTDPRFRRLRALGVATAAPVLTGLLLVGCSDSSTATATEGSAVTTDNSASGSSDATTDGTAAEDHDHGSDTTAAEDHDHGSDTTAAEHDHGTDDSAADHDHAEGALDVEALHDLDDELAGGTLDAEKQRAVVADYIEQVEAMKPAAGSPEAELLTLLQDLDAALAAGDVAKAAPLAMQAHDAAHELGGHSA